MRSSKVTLFLCFILLSFVSCEEEIPAKEADLESKTASVSTSSGSSEEKLPDLDLGALKDLDIGDLGALLGNAGGIDEMLKDVVQGDVIKNLFKSDGAISSLFKNPEIMGLMGELADANGPLAQAMKDPKLNDLMGGSGDIASMMSNPLLKAFMKNFDAENFLKNLNVEDMLSSFLASGGMEGLMGPKSPLGEMMKNPEMLSMAAQMMGSNMDISKMMQGMDLDKMMEGMDLDKVMKAMDGGAGKMAQQLFSGIQKPKKEEKTPEPKQAPNLDEFAKMVGQLGGLDKVVDMMKEMGMEDMLEKAGGPEALAALLESQGLDAGASAASAETPQEEAVAEAEDAVAEAEDADAAKGHSEL